MAKQELSDYEVAIKENSHQNEIIRIFATIFLTASVIAWFGYYFHLNSIDKQINIIQSQINILESSLLSSAHEQKNSIFQKNFYEDKIKILEEDKKKLEQQVYDLEQEISKKAANENDAL